MRRRGKGYAVSQGQISPLFDHSQVPGRLPASLTLCTYLSSVVFFLLLVITTLTALLKHLSSEKCPCPSQGVGQDDL